MGDLENKIRNLSYHDKLEVFADKDKDVFSYGMAAYLSTDLFFKEYFLNKMKDKIRNDKKLESYLKGIYLARRNEKYLLYEELKNETINNYPILGRIAILCSDLGYILVPK